MEIYDPEEWTLTVNGKVILRGSRHAWERDWRVGRKVGRTIYRVVESTSSEAPDDVLIGCMDTVEDAKLAAMAPELARVLMQAEVSERCPWCDEVDDDHLDDCSWLVTMRKLGARE